MKHLTLFLFVVMLTAYTTTRYIPVETVRTDTLRITKHQYDSIFVHDSIRENQKGDTLLIERWHTKYEVQLVYDTLYQHRIDTVAKPYPVEVKVEKELTWWQKLRLRLGNLMLVLIGFAVVYAVIKLYLKFRKPYTI